MRFKHRYLLLALTMAATPLVIVVAPSASADCVDSRGVTVCSQGSVRGGPVTGPVVPFDCPYDWYCANFGLDSQLDGPPPSRPPEESRPPQP